MTALRNTKIALTPKAAPFAIRAERASDLVAREALLDACFGVNRQLRTCQRLRDGRAPAVGLALSAVREGRLVGTVQLWHVSAGGVPALMLGPLAVDEASRTLGVGAALMARALETARQRGHGAVILLGDAPYYARFGFSAAKTFGNSAAMSAAVCRGLTRDITTTFTSGNFFRSASSSRAG